MYKTVHVRAIGVCESRNPKIIVSRRKNNLSSYYTTVKPQESYCNRPSAIVLHCSRYRFVRSSWLRSFIEEIDKTGSVVRTCNSAGLLRRHRTVRPRRFYRLFATFVIPEVE